MALPLVPFIAGALVGGVSTYLYRDKKTRKKIGKQVRSATDKVTESVSSVRGKLTGKKAKQDSDMVEMPVEESVSAENAETLKDVIADKT